jgi:hypothetical protein
MQPSGKDRDYFLLFHCRGCAKNKI